MSVSSGDILDTFASHSFTFQAPVDYTTVVNKKKARISKKRKASTANISSANASDNENAAAKTANSSQNTAYYLQLAVDNLLIALDKETDQSIQTKIQFLVTKAQHVLMNTADIESDSQIDLQHQIQAIKADIECKFKEIQTMIANLQFINQPATNNYIVAEPATSSTSQSVSQSASQLAAAAATTNSTENSGENSTHSAEHLTYAQAAAKAKANENCGKSLNKVDEKRSSFARSKSSSKQTELNATSNSKLNSKSFSYRERRLILLNSKNSALTTADSMKLRDKINSEFQKQLKLSASKPVIAAITKSYKQQNIVIMTMSNYNADFLIQHENIWKNSFKYQGFYKDKTWYKIIAHGIPTAIFNYSKGLDLLHEEIKIFNGIQPLAINWLSSEKNRETKNHASIVISFDNEAAAQRALKNKLLIAGITVRTAAFIEKKSTIQCLKCQKFGHATSSCKNLAACQFCAENHPTRLHICKICEVQNEVCIHTTIKCVNCGNKHTANSKECSVLNAILAANQLETSNSMEISE